MLEASVLSCDGLQHRWDASFRVTEKAFDAFFLVFLFTAEAILKDGLDTRIIECLLELIY
jgi:hypothetical protein